MEERRDVLEELRRRVGCLYISDMRVDGQVNRRARACLQTLDRSAYAPEVWDEAVRYLAWPTEESGGPPSVCPR